jgi:hypothetical protein
VHFHVFGRCQYSYTNTIQCKHGGMRDKIARWLIYGHALFRVQYYWSLQPQAHTHTRNAVCRPRVLRLQTKTMFCVCLICDSSRRTDGLTSLHFLEFTGTSMCCVLHESHANGNDITFWKFFLILIEITLVWSSTKTFFGFRIYDAHLEGRQSCV